MLEMLAAAAPEAAAAAPAVASKLHVGLAAIGSALGVGTVSYTHLTLPTNREV